MAREIERLFGGFTGLDKSPWVLGSLRQALGRYSDLLTPWAAAVSGRVISEIDQQNATAWQRHSRDMGHALRREIANTQTGAAMRQLQAEQVALIKSLPIEAGERVQRLATQGLYTGSRASELAKQIGRTGEVTASRATLIARTETTRASTTLTQVRADAVGATMFIWRTAEDADVRPSHRKLNGRPFRWDDPPECDPGQHALPGCIWNCRCYAEPIIPDVGE